MKLFKIVAQYSTSAHDGYSLPPMTYLVFERNEVMAKSQLYDFKIKKEDDDLEIISVQELEQGFVTPTI